MSTRPNREIHVHHAEGAPEAVISAVKTERELQRLIAGEGAVDKSQISEVVKKLHLFHPWALRRADPAAEQHL